ncbi:MAG TPA: hypothetical protein VEC08_02185 [Nitrososphaerales archaeon]|nr:hypothetical protein [Nitrososphaerales archaeon]
MPTFESPVEEAARVLDAASANGVVLRLFGGVSFWFRCPSARHPTLQRKYVDVDFMGHSKQSREIKQLFVSLGYVPRDKFNAIQGYRRLIFNDMANQRRVDVFLDVFEMCHSFNFRDRLEVDAKTIPLADMLVTKIQIIDVNEKDLKDAVCLFADYDVGASDKEMINGAYIASLCASDWGVYKTFTTNLDRLLAKLSDLSLGDDVKATVRSRVNKLRTTIEDKPKDLRWRMRARVGERMKWYELPEADKEVVDSRMVNDEVQAKS